MKRLSLAVVALVFAACGAPPKADVLDLRQNLPPADAAFFDVLGGEYTIPAQSERMFCTDLVYTGDDTAFDELQTIQGKFGHHAVLLSSKKPNPPGTVIDCTDVTTMANYDAFTIGDTKLPAGHGTFLPKGKQMVLQSHYLNTGKVDILVRDVVRAHLAAIPTITSWDSIYVNNNLDFMIPPHAMAVTQEFDCPVDHDTSILILGGHMHEWGAKFESVYIDSAGVSAPLYHVDQWQPAYRDVPPVDLYLTNPKLLKAGGKIHTTCTWNNTSDNTLKFPAEMCTLFGFEAGHKDPTICGAPKL